MRRRFLAWRRAVLVLICRRTGRACAARDRVESYRALPDAARAYDRAYAGALLDGLARCRG